MSGNNDWSSWSIPKKSKPAPSSSEEPTTSITSVPSMDMTIPKKKKKFPPPPTADDSRMATIPRKTPSTRNFSSVPIPKKRGYDQVGSLASTSEEHRSSFGSIPKKKSSSGGNTSYPSFSLDQMPAIPKKRPTLEAHRSSSSSSVMASSLGVAIPRKKISSATHSEASSSSTPSLPIKTKKKLSISSSLKSDHVDHRSRSRNAIVSDFPLIIRLSTRNVPMTRGIPRFLAPVQDRHEKQVRKNYKEPDENDELFLMDSDEDEGSYGKKKRKNKVAKVTVSTDGGGPHAPDPGAIVAAPVAGTAADVTTSTPAMVDGLSLDSPPPGTLNTLWYSRECFLHVLVVEKVIAWRTRHTTTLEWVPESLPVNSDESSPPQAPPSIDAADAAKWSQLALTNPLIWTDPGVRMEVSRLVPKRCPIVAAMATVAQATNEGPRFRLQIKDDDQEEVYLVKWRGRSHMHASWERGSDIIKFDQSKNTARHKIRRFVQSQELAFGLEWKKVLQEERDANSASSPSPDDTAAVPESTANVVVTHQHADSQEEYFPPAHLEIERILACDESEMDMNLFAKQRGLNIKEEQERIQEQEEGTIRKWNSEQRLQDLLRERPWDPEDNVRYVVKWKGLPFTEITWEYWRDIKRDAVDEAEDFWLRQQPPDPDRVLQLVQKQHPHISEFRKLQTSPSFGLSKRERPIADMGQAKDDDDDGSSSPGFKLRSYQLEGVNWLLFNWWNRRSCILADEMGLGKTIQSMCFLKSLQDMPSTDVRGPFLIVAPLSLIGQWQSEAKSWAPDLNVVLYHGSADARDFLVQQDFFFTDQFVSKPTAIKLRKQHVTKFHILITTYEVVLKDVAVFQKIRWRALIVDEAHRLKNSKARLFEDLGSVPRDFCLLLTGTPLANATEELWALLHFADKKAFADKDAFLEKFGEMTGAEQVSELHTLLKPYLLRRVKEDVEKSLPPKEETILEVSLTPIQKKYYKAIYERNTQYLYKGAKANNAPSLMNVMMELRKCCNHPFLIRGAEERILTEAADQLTPEKDREGNSRTVDHGKLFGDQLIKASGKMVLIHKLLPKLFANGHKVLIFSQMVRALDLLEEHLRLMKYKYERLDGTKTSSSRAAAVDRFCRASCQRFVMLLSTRAGGLGLNLTAADVVIIFDSDWNPQNDLQAMARAHRIGQTRAVRVYRLITAKTYEMHMFHSASMKLGLERAVLAQQREQGDEAETSGKSKSRKDKEAQAKEIDSLLKKGAYDVFKEEDDEEAQKFMETDIDQLLESNAQTVTYNNTDGKNNGGLGSFSKASFVTDTGEGGKDVDLDDPDFWKKTAGLEAPVETPEDVAQMLDDGVKRSRKQVEQFNPFEDYLKIEQAKEDKRLQKLKEEKEEKERIRLEKRSKKMSEKERRKKERQEIRGSLFGKSSSQVPVSKPKPEIKFKLKKKPLVLPTTKHPLKDKPIVNPVKDTKLARPKKSGARKRAIRRAQYEDPEVERLKQGWEVPQRNRAISACLRFGFDRYCKIRGEANLTSLPIQDIEVFFRSYFFQLSLQLVVALLETLKDQRSVYKESNIKEYIKVCLGRPERKELEWLGDCVANGMKCYLEIESGSRYLRLPVVMAEASFLADLRRGAALRALRRIFLLSRITRIVEVCLDENLSEIGYEQLAKRGCPTGNFASLDADLKARVISTEELLLTISSKFKAVSSSRSPAFWWDRNCDMSLLLGTFIHGLGNYDSMLNDESLAFSRNVKQFASSNEACATAHRLFLAVSKATSKVFHQALEAAKVKDQLQIQAAVAAAAAASSEREKSALALRESGEILNPALHDNPTDNLYETKDDDSHFITLRRLKKSISTATRSEMQDSMEESTPSPAQESSETSEEKSGRKRGNSTRVLGMPDARILDQRLILVLSEIERCMFPEEVNERDEVDPEVWPTTPAISLNIATKKKMDTFVFGSMLDEEDFGSSGIGIHGVQSGASHRSLDDGSDYFVGSANHDLSQVAYGSDAPRYLRGIGVPMNVTRFAVSALAHADSCCVETLLKLEEERSDYEKMKSTVHSDYKDVSAKKLTIKEETTPLIPPMPHEKGATAGSSIDKQNNKLSVSVGVDNKSPSVDIFPDNPKYSGAGAVILSKDTPTPSTPGVQDKEFSAPPGSGAVSHSNIAVDTDNASAQNEDNMDEVSPKKEVMGTEQKNNETARREFTIESPRAELPNSAPTSKARENEDGTQTTAMDIGTPRHEGDSSESNTIANSKVQSYPTLANGGDRKEHDDTLVSHADDSMDIDQPTKMDTSSLDNETNAKPSVPSESLKVDDLTASDIPSEQKVATKITKEIHPPTQEEIASDQPADDKSGIERIEEQQIVPPKIDALLTSTAPSTQAATVPSPKEVQSADTKIEPGEATPSKSQQELEESKPEIKSITPVKPLPTVPKVFLDNPGLRAAVCSALLYFGFPSEHGTEAKLISKSLLNRFFAVSDETATTTFEDLFDMDRFSKIVCDICLDKSEVPSHKELREYVLEWLLPHCLRLCIMGNGPTLENARGSKGEYETAMGASLHPEPSQKRQCVLPDPCLPLGEHSVQALASALAILRRHQMMGSAMALSQGTVVPVETILDSVLRSSFMCKSMLGLPIWWCPWIHDAALLVYASSHGLFALLRDRQAQTIPPSCVFSHQATVDHMRATFSSKKLPATIPDCDNEETWKEWIEFHAQDFPSPNVLEQRLAFLCAKATESLDHHDGDQKESSSTTSVRYDNLPMFDHGAWPRN